MDKIAQVYARALFEAARDRGLLDLIREQLGQFVAALNENREMAIFLFSPYFSTEEKKEGLSRVVTDADPVFMNFLDLLVEGHRMPVIFAIHERYEQLWDEQMMYLPVQITSAVDLDSATINTIGARIGEQTGRQVEVSSAVDPEILGGIVVRVGNVIMDASIRNQLNQLRKQVARA
jgi:F-type H+-transporting ATPase subunit delta